MGCESSKAGDVATTDLTLCIWPGSAPCRAVIMAASAANIYIRIERINIFKGEHKVNPITKMNPEQTVPTLKDEKENKLVSNSHAIMVYLIDTYAPKHQLYPQKIEERKAIDKFLKYDLKTVYPAISSWIYPQIFGSAASDKSKEEEVTSVLNQLDTDLADREYLATSCLTIADLAVAANLSLLELVYYDVSSWQHLWSWLQRIKSLPYYAACNKGLEDWKLVLHIREQNRLHRDQLKRQVLESPRV